MKTVFLTDSSCSQLWRIHKFLQNWNNQAHLQHSFWSRAKLVRGIRAWTCLNHCFTRAKCEVSMPFPTNSKDLKLPSTSNLCLRRDWILTRVLPKIVQFAAVGCSSETFGLLEVLDILNTVTINQPKLLALLAFVFHDPTLSCRWPVPSWHEFCEVNLSHHATAGSQSHPQGLLPVFPIVNAI